MSDKLLSVCLITKDEAQNLATCLKSIKNLADEIIVVDTGSTDNTVEIARKFGARVYVFPWNNNFSAARNFALKQAEGCWVFIIDADEELKTIAKKEWMSLLNDQGKEAYFVQISNYEDRQNSVSQPALRLFRNKKDYYYQGRIHEQVLPQILKKNPFSKIGYTDLLINHYGYTSQMVEQKKKIERNIGILQLELKHNPKNPFMRFNLGNEYYRQGEYKLAIWQYRAVLESIDKQFSYYPYLIFKLAIAYLAGGYHLECRRILQDGLKEFPDYTDLYYLLGEAYLNTGDFAKAVGVFEKCLELGAPPSQYVSINGVGTDKAAYYLGKCYEYNFNIDKAIDYYHLAFTQNPTNSSILQDLLDLYVKYHSEKEMENFISTNRAFLRGKALNLLLKGIVDYYPGLVIKIYEEGFCSSFVEKNYIITQAYWNKGELDKLDGIFNSFSPDDYQIKELSILLYQYYWYRGNREGIVTLIETQGEQAYFNIKEIDYLFTGRKSLGTVKDSTLLETLYLLLKNYLTIAYQPGIDKILDIYQGIILSDSMKMKLGKLLFRKGCWREAIDQFLGLKDQKLDEESLRYLAVMALEGDDMQAAFDFMEKALTDQEASLISCLTYLKLLYINIMDYCQKSAGVFTDYPYFTEIEEGIQKGVDRIDTFNLYDSQG
ncbi:glycosyltransferase [Halocella sp. SP3-1]|uniref:tetratricopeptide repeat-containing glycosyltransferase family 2 protein n=1 Tax=Halocella sp. SP3-1 TaxID=2382161 RepID=UPI000F756B00|nr:glycosyltransferase [Halocella sp. SP3-1]AZO93809.1 glycosyltransferase [Halocella sp. SP3-1]